MIWQKRMRPVATLKDKAKFASEATGFTIQDCLEVLRAAEDFDYIELSKGNSIKYGKLFTLQPVKVAKRKRYDVYHKRVVTVASHWVLKTKTHKRARVAISKIKPQD